MVYQQLKRLGFPDSHIILMLADDHAHMPRNPFPGSIEVTMDNQDVLDLYTWDTEVDYRGLDVSPEVLEAILTGESSTRPSPEGAPSRTLPPQKQLNLSANANVLLYMTGHGGEGFLKFHDKYELAYSHLADVIDTAHRKGRFRRLLIVADTCKAASALKAQRTPGVFGIASSSRGEDSYSHTWDQALGLSTSDAFTYFLVDFLRRLPAPIHGAVDPASALHLAAPKRKKGQAAVTSDPAAAVTGMAQLFDQLQRLPLHSTVRTRADLLQGGDQELAGMRIVDFFAARKYVL